MVDVIGFNPSHRQHLRPIPTVGAQQCNGRSGVTEPRPESLGSDTSSQVATPKRPNDDFEHKRRERPAKA